MTLWREVRDLARLVLEAAGREKKLMVATGDRAPAFRVADHEGRERTLDEFRGQKVLLWFYPRADTPG